MFNFKLESVLLYRKAMEEKRLVDLAEEKKRLAAEHERLEGLKREEDALCAQLKGLQGELCPAADIGLYLSYLKLVKEREDVQEEVVSKVSKEVEVKKDILTEAVKNRKVMDILKDHQYREYKENLAAFERKMTDEVAVLKFVRKEIHKEK